MVDKSNKGLDDPDYASMAQLMDTLARVNAPRQQHFLGLDPGQPPYVGLAHRRNQLYLDPRTGKPYGALTEKQWALPPDVQPSVR